MMNKLLIFLSVLIVFSSCKGPGTGPLVKDSFNKSEKHQDMLHQDHQSTVRSEKINAVIEPCEGCITIAILLENKKIYAGKTVKVKGKVSKYNPGIMGKNWVHIQDGSEFDGEFDLTITTDKPATLGDIITFEGRIVLDKDFGYGYFYKVLMEEARSIKF